MELFRRGEERKRPAAVVCTGAGPKRAEPPRSSQRILLARSYAPAPEITRDRQLAKLPTRCVRERLYLYTDDATDGSRESRHESDDSLASTCSARWRPGSTGGSTCQLSATTDWLFQWCNYFPDATFTHSGDLTSKSALSSEGGRAPPIKPSIVSDVAGFAIATRHFAAAPTALSRIN